MRKKRKRSVLIYSPCKALELDKSVLESTFRFLDQNATYSIPDGELSLVFLEHDAHNQLHADFLNDPTPTDVITFPGDAAEAMAGEICVSIDTARAYAREHNLNFSMELTLYLVHGWLHLAGFDDKNDADRVNMKKEEQACMSLLETNGMIPMFKYSLND